MRPRRPRCRSRSTAQRLGVVAANAGLAESPLARQATKPILDTRENRLAKSGRVAAGIATRAVAGAMTPVIGETLKIHNELPVASPSRCR